MIPRPRPKRAALLRAGDESYLIIHVWLIDSSKKPRTPTLDNELILSGGVNTSVSLTVCVTLLLHDTL